MICKYFLPFMSCTFTLKVFFWRGYQIASFERMVQKNLSRCFGTTCRKGKGYLQKNTFRVLWSPSCVNQLCGHPVLCITLLIQAVSLNEVSEWGLILSVASSCSSSSDWFTLPKCHIHSAAFSSFSRSLGSGSLVSLEEDVVTSSILQLHQFLSMFPVLMRLVKKLFVKVLQSHTIAAKVVRHGQAEAGSVGLQVDLAVDGGLWVLLVVLALQWGTSVVRAGGEERR